MSNIYVQFCFGVKATPEQRNLFLEIHSAAQAGFLDDEAYAALSDEVIHLAEQHGWDSAAVTVEETDYGFCVFSRESGEPSVVAEMLQEWLKLTKQDDAVVAFTWSETSDRMRVGEFSGGGVAISADEIRWFIPAQQLLDYVVEKDKEKK